MDTITLALFAVLVVLAIAGWLIWQNRQTQQLRSRYGTEYERIVSAIGQRRATAELRAREERVAHLEIRALSPEQRDRFAREWQHVQAQFVDDPHGAVRSGDRLVDEAMHARGYPVANVEQRVADLSVQHPRVVQNFRAAREIAERHRRGEATTEDLRRAMVYYRELFEDLLDRGDQPKRRAAELVVERGVVRERIEPVARRLDHPRPSDREVPP